VVSAETSAALAVLAQRHLCVLYQLQMNLQSMKQLELVKEPLQPCRRKCQRPSSKWFVQSRLKYSSVVKKNQIDVTFFVLFIYLLIVAQHISGNHVPIVRS